MGSVTVLLVAGKPHPSLQFTSGLPADIQAQQDAFFNNGSGGLYSSVAPGAGDGVGGWGEANGDYTGQWNAILSGTGFSTGPGGLIYNAENDRGVGDVDDAMIAPYIGRDLYFSANGSLLSAVYNSSNGGAISARMEGNTNNEQGVLYTDQLLHLLGDLPSLDLDQYPGSNLVDYEGFWSKAWNSIIARAIVPDLISIHISATLVPIVGGGASYNFDLVTRGKDAGLHRSVSGSLRAGEEGGIGISLNRGWFLGSGENVNYNSPKSGARMSSCRSDR